MGQKINPVSLRLQYTNRYFDNCWYSGYFYKTLITKDIFLQHYLNTFLKLIKIPTGRFSIHHLQKKTQIYNFFCYSKSTRLWRSNLFGLTKKKKYLKKSRYFLQNKIKTKTKFSPNLKKNKKFINTNFYKRINQQQIFNIQNRITNFQNFNLWSSFQKTTSAPNSMNKQQQLSILKNFQLNYLHLTQYNLLQQQSIINKVYTNKILANIFEKSQKSKVQEKPFNNIHSINFLKSNDSKKNINLMFLQNLFIYKTLKARLKKKNIQTIFFLENKKVNADFSKKKDLQSKNLETLLKPVKFKKESLVFNTFESKYKNYLESSLFSLYNVELDLIPFKVKNDWQHASYLADEIVYFLEKRIPFRRLKGKLLKQLSRIESIRGIRITCSGRVGGKSKKAQRSKIECLKYGQTSLHVFSSKIDFSFKTAFTSFGSIGVKVWICYN